MRQIIIQLTLALMVVFSGHQALAASYYFSQSTGDDSRSAAQAQHPDTPWKSIDKLNAVFHTLKPGDVVYFKRGDVFYGTIEVTKSGSPGNPIVFDAYGTGAKPVITSLITLKNWKAKGSGIYESSDSRLKGQSVNMVLLDGVTQEMGRYPNSNAADGGYLTIDAHQGNTSVTSNALTASPNWTGGEVVIRKNYWITDRHPISGHSGGRINYTLIKESWYSPSKGFGFFIQNHIKTLDALGEWYYNPSTKNLAVYFGSTAPASAEVKVSTLDYLVRKANWGGGYLRFKNLHFEGANKDAFHMKGGKNVEVLNCDITYSGENGIFAEGALDYKVEDNTIRHTNNNAIKFLHSTHNSTFRNNIIEDNYLLPGLGLSGDGNGVAIFAPGNNSVFEYNSISRTGYIGIHFGGNNTLVKNNFVNYFCLTKNDGGGIYTYTGNSNATLTNRKVIGNVVLNGIGVREGSNMSTPMSKPQSEGIYLDDNASGVEVRNNTIANITSKGIYLHNARENRIVDNLIYNTDVQLSFVSDHLGADIRDNVIEGNVFFSKSPEQHNLMFTTPKNDIAQMARFDKNIYANPFSDNFRIVKNYMVYTPNEVKKTVDLLSWQKKFGVDKNSNVQPVTIPAYEVKSLLGQNKYDNSGFDRHANYITLNGGSGSWESNSDLDGGAFKIKGSGPVEGLFHIGKVEGGKSYLLKFSAKANKSFSGKVYFRHKGSPWQALSAEHGFEVNTTRNEYEFALQPVINAGEASVLIRFDDLPSAEVQIDNLELYEADIVRTNPDEVLLFEVNPTKTSKTVILDGTYVDPNNVEYTGTVTLEPFSSILLTKIAEAAKPVEEEALPPAIAIVSPTHNAAFEGPRSIEIQVEAEGKGCGIKKVQFFSGNRLLGTAESAPYIYVGESVQPGTYTITAKATDENAKVAVSEAVVVVVKENFIASPVLPDEVLPDNGEAPFEMYLNTGTSKDVTFNGKVFKGDKNLKFHGASYEHANATASKEELYQTERNGNKLNYAIPVPNGIYTVKTYHNELYWGLYGRAGGEGRRVFDIRLEGKLVKDDFDIFKENRNKQVVLTFENIEVKDGKLNLDMVSSRDRASISGIAITGSKASEPAQPVEVTKPAEVAKPVQPDFELYLNTGTVADVTFGGKVFKGDKNLKFHGASYEHANATASKEELYQTERNGNKLNYAIPVPNGIYTVKTYHNELYWGLYGRAGGEGRRVFDIRLEGKLVKDDFDIFKANRNKQIVLTFENIEVKDGKLNLDMVSSRDRASISGIAIIGSKASEPAQPVEVTKPEEVAKPAQPAFELYLNTGTSADVTFGGKLFKGDKNLKFHGASYENANPSASKDKLFQTERNGPNLKYAIAVPNGTYTVKTYHNELWWGKGGRAGGKGRRVFDIRIEGKLLKDDFDLFVASKNKQIVLTFENIEVKDGKLNLDMVSSRDRASISGIAILASNAVAKPVKPVQPSFEMYLNTGSSKDVTLGGKLFKGDKSLKIYGPSYEHANATASKEELYQTERNGNKLNYTIPVPNGTYTVKTYHNELYWGLYGRAGGKGRRVFDIRLEGKLVKDDFDIFVENQNKAVVLTFTNIEVKDGKLNLDMVSSRDRASISGIELFGHGTQQAKKAAQAKLDQVAETLVVEKAVDLVEVDNALEVKLYPNPASEFTNLSLSQDVALTHILIHDMNGQLMKQFDPRMLKKDGGQYQVPLDNLSNGLYLVSVVGEREVVDRLRLIVR